MFETTVLVASGKRPIFIGPPEFTEPDGGKEFSPPSHHRKYHVQRTVTWAYIGVVRKNSCYVTVLARAAKKEALLSFTQDNGEVVTITFES